VNLEAPLYGVPDHIENWATTFAALGAVGSFVYCARTAVGRRSALPLYLFIGGAMTTLVEPFIDTLGHAIFAQEDRISWTSTFGRHIPAYIGLILMFYVAPAYLALLGAFERGIPARRFGAICAGMVTATLVFEFVPMHYDLWRYYGEQGPQIGDMPIWFAFTNANGLIGTAVVLHLLLRVIPANRQFLLVPLMPALFLGVHTVGSTWGYLGINSATSQTAAYLGTIGACATCTALFWLYSKVVCREEAPAPVPAHAETITATAQ
jgi:hypothetical protein